jgi:two-component system, cell cycle sensor histidine kinase and response regulator CckA
VHAIPRRTREGTAVSRRLPLWTGSLRARLLLPLVVAGVAVIGGGGWFTRRAIEQRFQGQLVEEAVRLGRTLGRALEMQDSLSDVQRVVAAAGADPDVDAVILVGGMPPTVLASSRGALRGLALGALREHAAADLLRATLADGVGRSVRDLGAGRLTLTVPIGAGARFVPESLPASGAVLLRLDERPSLASLERSALRAGLAVSLLLALFIFATWHLVGVEVTTPLARIARAAAARSAGEPAATIAVSGAAEIEALGRALEGAFGAVLASEGRYREMVEHLPAGAVLVQGERLLLNRAAEALTGYGREEIATVADWFARLHPGHAVEARGHYQEQRATGFAEARESPIVRRDGEIRIVQFAAFAYAGGEVWLIHDVTERRRAEEALEASLANLRAVFEGSPQIFILLDAEGVIEAFNWQASVRSLAALGAEFQIGVPYLSLVPPAGVERFRAHFAQALRGETAVADWPYVGPDGGEVFLDVIYSPVFDMHGGVRGVLLSATDVTARREAEQALRESEERFRSLYEHATLGLYRTTPDGHILLANPALVRMLGYASDEEPAARDLQSAGACEPGYVRSEFLRQFDAAGEIHGLESEWRRKDGTIMVVRESARVVRDASGAPAYYDGVVEDVTERRLAEQALRESEERFRSLFEQSHVAMLVVDPGTRTIIEANGTAEAFYGRGPGGLDGLGFADLLADPADAEALFAAGSRAAPPGELRSRHRAAGGEVRDVEVHAGALVQYGAPLLLCIVHDISERLRAEAERVRLLQKVVETQRLESLAVMAGGVAHDFNNLLTGVLANVSLARGKVPPGTDLPRHLDQIEQAGQRAADLSRQMLAYTGKGRLALEVLDVSRMVRDSVAILEASVSKKVRLETTLGSDLPRVQVDSSQIRQVLMSLVLNAAEATGDDGGTVRVRTALRMADRALFAEAHLAPDLPEGPYLALEVSDDGHGMDAATVARMFDPFFTTRFTGRGLGLAAVLGIVRSHKGAVLIRSAPGRGTTVTVLLPSAVGAEEVAEREFVPPRADRPIVLIVDDEVLVRRVAANILSACGFRPVLAADGRDALVRFAQHGGDVRALLLDVAMPHLDGVEMLRELRRRGCQAPALVMSGLAREAVWPRFEGLGVADFVPKPFTPSALRHKVAAVFGSVAEGSSA